MLLRTTKDVSRVIRRARLNRGWTQAQLAQHLGCTQKWVSHVETGRTDPQLDSVLRALAVLKATVIVQLSAPDSPQKVAYPSSRAAIDQIATGKSRGSKSDG